MNTQILMQQVSIKYTAGNPDILVTAASPVRPGGLTPPAALPSLGHPVVHSGFCGEVTELAEGARLEIVCAAQPYRGFESHPLRQITLPDIRACTDSGAVPDGGLAVPCTGNPLQPDRIPVRGGAAPSGRSVSSDEGRVPRDGRPLNPVRPGREQRQVGTSGRRGGAWPEPAAGGAGGRRPSTAGVRPHSP